MWDSTQSTEENSNINYSTSQDTFINGKAKRLHSDCRGVKGLPCTVSQLSWMMYDTLLRQLELWPEAACRHISITHNHPVFEARLILEATEEPYLRRKRLH